MADRYCGCAAETGSMAIIVSLVTAWAFERAHMIISAPNYGALWNGFGAIDLTVQRNIKAPAAYRVLMPFLVVGIEKLFHTPPVRRIDIYQTLKILMETLAFWAIWQVWGLPVMLLTGILLLLTIRFDYWSWGIELAGIALAMTGNLSLAIPGAILFGLSRETAVLSGVAFYAVTGNLGQAFVVESAAVLALVLVRLWVGKRPLYCDRFMIHISLKPFKISGPNVDMWKPFFKYQPIYHSDVFIAAVISLLTLFAVLQRPTGWIIPLVMLGAGWTITRADETRVFTACLPWIAAMMIGGI
jgi:hypothetical protein